MFTVSEAGPWQPEPFTKKPATTARARVAWIVSAVLAVGALTAVAAWWYVTSGEPRGFRDVPWEASGAELSVEGGISQCSPSEPAREDLGTSRCRAEANVSVENVTLDDLWFYLRDGRLVAWRMRYGGEHHAVMMVALRKRYGRPSTEADTYAVWKLRGGGVVLKRDKFQDVVTVVSKAEMANVSDLVH